MNDTDATRMLIVNEIVEERRHQIEDHGWTPDHDDLHTTEDFAWLIARRAVEMCHRDAAYTVDARRLLIEISAISIAAIEAFDRQEVRRVAPSQAGQ